jgi:hypothetical protein
VNQLFFNILLTHFVQIKQDATIVTPQVAVEAAPTAANIAPNTESNASAELPVVESRPIELPANPLFQSAGALSEESSSSVTIASEIASERASSETDSAKPADGTAAPIDTQLPEVQLSGNPLFSDAVSNPLFAASTSNIESVVAPVESFTQPVADVLPESEEHMPSVQLSENPLFENAVGNPLFASGPESTEPVAALIPEPVAQPDLVASQQTQSEDQVPLSNNPLFGAVGESVVEAVPAVSESVESTPNPSVSVVDPTVTPPSETMQAVALSDNPLFAAPLATEVSDIAAPVVAEVAVESVSAVSLTANPLFPDAIVNPLFSAPSDISVSIDSALATPAVDASIAAAVCVVESVQSVDTTAEEESQSSAPDTSLLTNPLFDSAIHAESAVVISTEGQSETSNVAVAESSTEAEQIEDEEPAPQKVMTEVQSEAFAAPPTRVHAVPSPVEDDHITVDDSKSLDCQPSVHSDITQEVVVVAKTEVPTNIAPEVLVESTVVTVAVEVASPEQDSTTDAANETKADEQTTDGQTDLTLQDMSSRILDEAQQRQNALQEQTAATRLRIANMALDLHQSLNTQTDAHVATVSQPTADMIDLVALVKERNEQAKKAEAEFRLKLESDRARKLQANQVTIKIQPADIKKLKPKKLEKAPGIVLLGGALSLLPHEVRYTDVELKRIYHEFTKRWNAFYVEQKTKRVDSSDVIQDPIGMHAQILLSVLISWIKADSTTVKARLDSHFGCASLLVCIIC